MSDNKIDIAFRVVQTDVRVVYAEIATITSEAIVSVEDVHLSMGGGVAAAIRKAAGHNPRADALKRPRPLPIGSVLVTSAGKLSARYIFHAIAIEFSPTQPIDQLIVQLIKRGLELANHLDIERIAVPLIGMGTLGLPPAKALELMIRGVACALASQATTLREVLITIFLDKASDHGQTEHKLAGDFAELRAMTVAWTTAIAPMNLRLASLRPVLATMKDDDELKQAITARIVADQEALRQLFAGTLLAQVADTSQTETVLTEDRYERLKRRLSALIQDLEEESDNFAELQQAEKRRLWVLLKQQAEEGSSTEASVVTQIEDLTRSTVERDKQLQDIYKRQDHMQRELDGLELRWNTQKPTSVDQA